jgi:ATP-dependent exoDNAse (exonuclease V) beta subunit
MTATQPLITLDPENHIYRCNGRILQSVGSVVKRLVPPFDRDRLSALTAKKRGITQAAVIKEWEDKRDIAADKGHEVHEMIDRALGGEEGRMQASVESLAEFGHWLKWWNEAQNSLVVIGTEHIVGDLDLAIAGTIDLLCSSTKTNRKHVFDWKTNGKFERENNYGENLLPPFDDLPNCHFTVHSLQVSLYRLLLERTGEVCGDSWIVHVNSVATPHRALDLRDRLEDWLLKTL